MGLKNIHLKGFYDSDADNLLLDFYIPVLEESIFYKRIAGYFSSNSLAISAKGISKFIDNGGKMHLIANVVLSENDQNTIKKAIHEKEMQILDEFETMDDALKRGHLGLLAWMIKNEILEIKIAAVKNGLEHKKKGIFKDIEGNEISFTGSDNETIGGWLHNHEDFHVFCSWLEGDKERHLDPDIKNFEELWNDQLNSVQVFEISDAFKKGLIQNAPANEEDFKTLSNEVTKMLVEKSKVGYLKHNVAEKPSKNNLDDFLRDYQIEAIGKWAENGNQGIFKMATGTGKTFTAFGAINHYLKEVGSGLIIIVAPTQLLVTQWSNQLKGLGYLNVVEVMKNSSVWKQDMNGSLLKIELGKANEAIAVATYDSFSSTTFVNLINKYKLNTFLICDEMHNSWAPKYKKGLLPSYQSRLGLSATPERYMDEMGTKEMQEYFGGIVYEFTIAQAIPEFLVEYEYHAETVELTDEEREEYHDLTHSIAKRIASNKGDIDDITLSIILKRSKLVSNSKSKWEAFNNILDSISSVKRTLIYCSNKQLPHILKILHSRKISACKITYKESPKERKRIIEDFISDKYDAIVAMKILDEGIDLPKIEQAIIMSSSGNPIEYVQRRGRILRKCDGKDFASIYDILIFPWKDIPENISKSELSIIRKEMKRVEEFVSTSTNPLEVMNDIIDYKYLLYDGDPYEEV
ncbi:DEAD/DEAH box helicase family protein [Methanococcoides seepicolus]|uniref:DEAD/DEAH box helicase family protein n=1 Tax=Methanococcoides seepicolus TaxID=2828780 RepID=A0A9E5DBD7_9EURY|nr:DEAD/DEAH box helicase family protein [Methanococcoides seepicolus]MCM1986817.1 DEAD/DEAH box helicase family protein [Methanococcoides seepicolus]